jgi:hypothetical protein
MMDFLRRLAPHGATSAARAVGVVPSRYASERPLRAQPLVPASTSEDEGTHERPPAPSQPAAAPAAADSGAMAQVSPGEVAASASSVRAAAERVPLDIPIVPERSRALRESGSASIARRSAENHHADDGQGDHRAQARPASARHVEAPPRGATPQMDEGLSVAAQPRPARRAPAAAVLPTRMASTATPISQAALASHARQQDDHRAVIHVTIDRIEVRAPAAPHGPAPASRPRAATPTMSLGDYLRARRPARAGGAS